LSTKNPAGGLFGFAWTANKNVLSSCLSNPLLGRVKNVQPRRTLKWSESRQAAIKKRALATLSGGSAGLSAPNGMTVLPPSSHLY
jgi:hypothetical protein